MWRIVQGLGGGALLSTSQAILFESFPREEYGIATALFGIGVMVGPTLGPTLGGWITDTWSWPWVFYINLPFGAFAVMMTLAFIRDSRFARRIEAVDWLGLALLATGIGALQTMLERGERQDWFASAEIVALAAGSVIALIWFVWHELHTEHPVIDLRILRSRQLAAGTAMGFVLGMCLFGTVFLLPVFLQSLQGFTANQTGLVILPGALASAFTMATMARTSGRYDPRISITAGVLVYVFSMWQWSHFTTQSGQADLFWPLIIRGAGLGLIFVPLTNLALTDLPMEQIPAGTGLFNLMRQLGGSVGIAISATQLSRFTTENRAVLATHVSRFDEGTRERLASMVQFLVSHGQSSVTAEAKAIAMLSGQVTRQAMMLSFSHLFLAFGLVFLIALPLLSFMHWRRGGGPGGGGAAH